MDLRELVKVVRRLLHSILEEIIRVPKAPGNQSKASNAEQGIQNLRVNLHPDAPCAVDMVAFTALGGAHGGRGVDEKKKEHAAPGDDVGHVYCDEEAHGCEKPPKKLLQSSSHNLPPRWLLLWSIIVGLGAGD